MAVLVLYNLCRQNVEIVDVGSEQVQRRTVEVLVVKTVAIGSKSRIYMHLLFNNKNCKGYLCLITKSRTGNSRGKHTCAVKPSRTWS